jgi:hypothetical protein
MAVATATSAIQSAADLENLPTADIGLHAKYAFSNPYSINGPFGTMDLVISYGNGQETASGAIVISTLWGLGTITQLTFSGPAQFNGSTGYTTFTAEGHGTITIRPNSPKAISTKISCSLKPGFEEGTLSVEGFFTDFTIKAISIIVGS